MESLAVRHLISTAYRSFPIKNPLNPFHTRRFCTRIQPFRFLPYSRKSDFQGSQSFAKPLRLFPATEVKFCTDFSVEKIVSSFKLGGSEYLYKVKIQTSSSYGSGLTDIHAGILLCLIDENGDSILQRIPSSSMKHHPLPSNDVALSEVFHFQQGSLDEFIFEGPELGKIEAVWVGIESGQWRLDGVSLTVICQLHSPTENEKNSTQYTGFQYDFELEEILLGERSDISMMEIRPSLFTEFSTDNLTMLVKNLSSPTSLGKFTVSNEESMEEYADLKFSLLLYDAILILAGSSIASVVVGEDAALGFLTGGIFGFLYLLLLQSSVDGLQAQAPESVSSNRTGIIDPILGRVKVPVSILVLAFTFAIIAANYNSGIGANLVTPKELMFGMTGFLACKVAVVLAAFNPMGISLKENK